MIAMASSFSLRAAKRRAALSDIPHARQHPGWNGRSEDVRRHVSEEDS